MLVAFCPKECNQVIVYFNGALATLRLGTFDLSFGKTLIRTLRRSALSELSSTPRNTDGFPAKLRLHDLRGTHEILLLDAGVPVHVVAARCGHDPAVLLRSYAKRTRKADSSAAAVIGSISRGVLS